MSKKICIFIISAVLMLLCLCACGNGAPVQDAASAPEETAEPTPTPVPTPEPLKLSVSDQSEHPALMWVNENGYFQAFQRVTRLEVCQAFAAALDGWEEADYAFSDFDPSQPEYAVAAALCSAGVFPVEEGEAFLPGKSLNREELTAFLELLSRSLEGEELVRIETLITDVEAAAFSGGGSSGSAVSRGEFAAVAVCLSGREPDEAALLIGGCLPGDVDTKSETWLYIADAVTEGQPEAPEEGVYRIDGELYGIGPDGKILRDTDYGVWTFDADGRYTTGDSTLDGFIRKALETCVTDDMTYEEALRAVYLHVKYDYQYLVTPMDMETEEPAATGWENERALRFFKYGGGTCYGFAAAFGLLARSVGARAHIVSAQVNQYYAPHGFVVIPEDGVEWIYDVEMEATRQERHDDCELFRIRNGQIYNYWYTPDW